MANRYIVREVADPEEKRRQIEEIFGDITRELLAKRSQRCVHSAGISSAPNAKKSSHFAPTTQRVVPA